MENNVDSRVSNFAVGPSSHKIICPHCRETVQTKVEYRPTLWTYILSCLFCPILCCCLPCVCGCLLNINQRCPNCEKFLGTYRRNLMPSIDE